MTRAQTLEEVARLSLAGASFDLALREFLDEFYAATLEERSRMIESEPAPLSSVEDAYLGAVAEHLARRCQLPLPGWSHQSARFLRTLFFAGGVEGLKPLLLKESPVAFRRRMIFVSANALARA